MESCPNDEGTYKMGYENITIDKVGEGKYLASGMVEVKETVEGPVNVSFEKQLKQISSEKCFIDLDGYS